MKKVIIALIVTGAIFLHLCYNVGKQINYTRCGNRKG